MESFCLAYACKLELVFEVRKFDGLKKLQDKFDPMVDEVWLPITIKNALKTKNSNLGNIFEEDPVFSYFSNTVATSMDK